MKITKGAGMVFLGSLVALFLGFVSRTLIARCGTEAEYGVYSLALVVLNVSVVIATLGLPEGVARSIAFSRARQEEKKVRALISAALQLTLSASFCLALAIFFGAELIVARLFHDINLAFALRVFAWGIPLSSLLSVLVAVFRGFDDVKPTVYFSQILMPLLFPLFLLPVFLFKLPFTSVFYAYLAALALSSLGLVGYSARKLPLSLRPGGLVGSSSAAGELLLFSLPLLGMAVLSLVILWTDTLMLGGLKSSLEVGLYSAAHPLAQFISSPLAAVGLIYVPVASSLCARGDMAELRRNFSILTKWLCAATLPLFLVLFLFPETVLGFVFGGSYVAAAGALRILCLGFIVNNLAGPNSGTLVALGENRFLMWTFLSTALLNVALNAVLIPPLGIEGAAIASATALVSINAVVGWKLYSLVRAQPLSRNLLKPAVASVALAFLFQFTFRHLMVVTPWMLPLLFILYYGIYGLAILLTRSFDREDIAMLLAIEKRAGVDLSLAKRLLRRFL